MSKAEAVQESQEELEKRLAEEAALSGEHFEPSDDDGAETGKAAEDTKLAAEKPKDDIDPDVLAAIAGEDKPKMIPHARFNEVNEESKARAARIHELELALARMEGSAPAKPKEEPAKAENFDFDEAEDRYAAALLDGESAKAKEIRREIRAREQEAADKRAEELADRRYKTNKAEDDAKRTKLEFDLELSKAYAAYPFLDATSADSNADAIEEALVWHQSFVAKGKSPADALIAAVAKVGPRYKAADVEVEKPGAEAPKPDLAKGIARADKIPAKPEGVGTRASTLNVAKMSGKDIKSLAPDEEARLAGDVV